MRWFHFVFLWVIILYLSANSPTAVCSPLICCNNRRSTQMCVIAFSHYLPAENKSLNLTVSVKTKGSTNSSSSGLCLEQKPCCGAGCRVQLPICTWGPTLAVHGPGTSRALWLQHPGLDTRHPCNKSTLHICRWHSNSEWKISGG